MCVSVGNQQSQRLKSQWSKSRKECGILKGQSTVARSEAKKNLRTQRIAKPSILPAKSKPTKTQRKSLPAKKVLPTKRVLPIKKVPKEAVRKAVKKSEPKKVDHREGGVNCQTCSPRGRDKRTW